jgi:hypothetical protein
VWAIDDWNRNYKLGVLFECRIGRGKLLISSFDLEEDSEPNPVLRQLRRSLLHYAGSARFQPLVAVTQQQLRDLFFDTRIMGRLGASARGEGGPANSAANAIDGDPNTYWLAGDPRTATRPQDLVISFPAEVPMSGLVLMPRQNHREHEGDMREFMVSVSDDGNEWVEVVRGELLSTFDPQRIVFPHTVSTRQVKLTALTGFGADRATAVAEVAVIYEGPKLRDADSRSLEYQRSKSATPDIDESNGEQEPQRKPKRKPRKRG